MEAALPEQAVDRLRYVPNQRTRTLPASRTESVGVVVPQPGSDFFVDRQMARLLRGIHEELSANGLQMLLFAPQSPADVQRLEQYLVGGHVDAVLFLAMHESDSLPARLRARGIPMVFGGRPLQSGDVSFVDVDNHAGGRTATEHLIEQGRRRIAQIGGPAHLSEARARLQGFREAMWTAALRSDFIEYGNLDRDGGEMAMGRLLAAADAVDAVFAASDAMAAGAMWTLQVLGRRVPDDVAVIGFDDSPIASATQPRLSSIRQPVEDMGREMAKLVVDMSTVHDRAPRQMVLSPKLSVRESTVTSR